MVVVFALGSALAYGLSDFLGGLLSRRASAWSVAVTAQAASAVITVVMAAVVTGHPTAGDWAWGAAAGIGSGVGSVFLYRGLGTGRMGVVAPLSGVGAALVPVLAGVAGGERPGVVTWIGVGCALPAIWLVSRSVDADGATTLSRSDLANGLLAGAGFGLLFACLGQVPQGAGLGPLATDQVVAVISIVALAVLVRVDWLPRDRHAWSGLLAGVIASSATLLFLLSTQAGYLTVAGVLTSLYPAATVVLAIIVLREHVHRAQGVGLMLAALAVALVAAS
ncbi:MAG: EamA family transporter [Nocardioidaceae bacterium]